MRHVRSTFEICFLILVTDFILVYMNVCRNADISPTAMDGARLAHGGIVGLINCVYVVIWNIKTSNMDLDLQRVIRYRNRRSILISQIIRNSIYTVIFSVVGVMSGFIAAYMKTGVIYTWNVDYKIYNQGVLLDSSSSMTGVEAWALSVLNLYLFMNVSILFVNLFWWYKDLTIVGMMIMCAFNLSDIFSKHPVFFNLYNLNIANNGYESVGRALLLLFGIFLTCICLVIATMIVCERREFYGDASTGSGE